MGLYPYIVKRECKKVKKITFDKNLSFTCVFSGEAIEQSEYVNL